MYPEKSKADGGGVFRLCGARKKSVMIARLRGRLLEKSPNQAIVDVQGVGYDVTIPLSTFYQLPDPPGEADLAIHTHVREDTIALYGFRTAREKQVFEKLLSVSGIGPKLAITVLSGLEASELIPAIRSNDLARLTRIPGVGKKTAERMVLELRDKLAGAESSTEPVYSGFSQPEEDVLSALTNLGYQRPVAERVLKGLAGREEMAFDTMLKKSLQALVK
jgi:holliday junction DNA helicase RuvA